MTAECLRCGRPMPDQAYVCTAETAKAAAQLAEIRELTPAARDVAYGIVRRSAGGSGSGKPGSRSPGNDDAMDTLDEVQNRLTTLARDIAEMRGLEILPDGSSRPLSASVAAENHSGVVRVGVDDDEGSEASPDRIEAA